jgi:PncC family amidohydrolase
MQTADAELDAACGLLARLLAAAGRRLVLAESCTAGLVAASLGRVPGISRHLVGSLVTYRDAAKTSWLGIPPAVLQRHTAVSEAVARLMAGGALAGTPEADLAASVTGHLGPDAPAPQDGIVYVGIAERHPETGEIAVVQVRRCQLNSRLRWPRQREAALCVLALLQEHLAGERERHRFAQEPA